MEVLLLIIAGIVLYMLYNSFQDYMKNPYKIAQPDNLVQEYKPEDNPYIQLSDEDKIKKTEFGILAQILAHIARSDGKVCDLERELINDILDDSAEELRDSYSNARELLQKIFDSCVGDSNTDSSADSGESNADSSDSRADLSANQNESQDLDSLANAFVEATKGEYKKRVKVVEFLFALAYADGILSENEREKIIDIAAIFELNNDDFNALYDNFENLYANELKLSQDRALEILGLDINHTKSDLENAYHDKIKAAKQNVFKSANKKDSAAHLREIDCAYKMLKVGQVKLIKSE